MNRIFQTCLLIAAVLCLLTAPAGMTLADGGGGAGGGLSDFSSPKNPDYVRANKLIQASRFEEALPLLKQVVAKDSQDADAYNLLGYATRKLGGFQEAMGYYETALRINPKHRGAREYMGEAYLQLGQLDKAKEQLAILDKDCWLGCEEYSDLKNAIARYEAGKRS